MKIIYSQNYLLKGWNLIIKRAIFYCPQREVGMAPPGKLIILCAYKPRIKNPTRWMRDSPFHPSSPYVANDSAKNKSAAADALPQP